MIGANAKESVANLVGPDTVAFDVSPYQIVLTENETTRIAEITSASYLFLIAVHQLLLDTGNELREHRERLFASVGDSEMQRQLTSRNLRIPINMIRPDVTISKKNGATRLGIVEIETMIGGLGFMTAIRNILGREDLFCGIPQAYTDLVKKIHETNSKPVIAVVIPPHKMRIYGPEFKYLATEVAEDLDLIVTDPRNLRLDNGILHALTENREWIKIDLIHRFFRLSEFDGTHPSIRKGDLTADDVRQLTQARDVLINAILQGAVKEIQPWIEPLESKGVMALLHAEEIKGYWIDKLGSETFYLLVSTIPHTAWIPGKRTNGWLKAANAWGTRGVIHQDDREAYISKLLEAKQKPYSHVLQADSSGSKFAVFGSIDKTPNQRHLRITPFHFGHEVAEIGVTASLKTTVHGTPDSIMSVVSVK